MFNTLLYPYATDENINDLKRLLLYFDKIYIISPFNLFGSIVNDSTWDKSIEILKKSSNLTFYETNDAQKKFALWKSNLIDKMITFENQIEYLQHEGIVEILHPIADDEFMLFFNKVMPKLDDNFTARFADYLNWKFPRSIMDKRTKPAGDVSYLGFESSQSVIGTMLMDFAIFIGSKHRIFPTTYDYELFNIFYNRIDWWLRAKKDYQQYLTRNGKDHLSNTLTKIDANLKIDRSNLLASETIKLSIPDFSELSFEDILELRKRHYPELSRFREELYNISNEINSTSINKQFYLEIRELIDHKVFPALEDLKNSLKFSREKYIAKIFQKYLGGKSTIQLCGITLVGVPLHYALIVNFGFAIATEYIDYYFEKRKIIEKNGMSFLMKLGS